MIPSSDPWTHLTIHRLEERLRTAEQSRRSRIGRPTLPSGRRIVRHVPLLLSLTVAMVSFGAACAEPAGQQAVPPTPVPSQPTGDEAAALTAAGGFLSAFERRDAQAMIGAMAASWKAGSGPDFVSAMGGTAAVHAVSLTVDRSRPIPTGSVLVRAELEVSPASNAAQPSPWNIGPNTRFLLMANENGVWKVNGLGG